MRGAPYPFSPAGTWKGKGKEKRERKKEEKGERKERKGNDCMKKKIIYGKNKESRGN